MYVIGQGIQLFAAHIRLKSASHVARTRNNKVCLNILIAQNPECMDAENNPCSSGDAYNEPAWRLTGVAHCAPSLEELGPKIKMSN
jgi:hypothetical protein